MQDMHDQSSMELDFRYKRFTSANLDLASKYYTATASETASERFSME